MKKTPLILASLALLSFASCDDDDKEAVLPSNVPVYLELHVETLPDGTTNSFANVCAYGEGGTRVNLPDKCGITVNGRQLRYHATDPNVENTYDFANVIALDNGVATYTVSTPMNSNYRVSMDMNDIQPVEVPDYGTLTNGKRYPFFEDSHASMKDNVQAFIVSINSATVTTYPTRNNGDGTFSFSGVPAGTYTVRFVSESRFPLPVTTGITGGIFTGWKVTQRNGIRIE